MPRTRFHELPVSRQRALLDVAGRHFAARGYAGASLNAILAEAGVPKGVAYYYFDDKADLYATVAEDAFARLAPLFPPTPDWPSLRRLYDANLTQLRERPWLAGLGRMEPPAEVAERLRPLGDALVALADACRRAGLLRDDIPADLLFAMIGGLDAAIDRWWVDHPDAGPHEADAAFAALRQLAEPDRTTRSSAAFERATLVASGDGGGRVGAAGRPGADDNGASDAEKGRDETGACARIGEPR